VTRLKKASLRAGITEKDFQRLHRKIVDAVLVGSASTGAYTTALRLIDAIPEKQRRSGRVGLLRVALLSGTGRRKALEKELRDLDHRFPNQARIALEFVEFYTNVSDERSALKWLRIAELRITKQTHRELQEAAICFRAALLARRKRIRAAQRLLVTALQRNPHSWMLASALNDVCSDEPYLPTI